VRLPRLCRAQTRRMKARIRTGPGATRSIAMRRQRLLLTAARGAMMTLQQDQFEKPRSFVGLLSDSYVSSFSWIRCNPCANPIACAGVRISNSLVLHRICIVQGMPRLHRGIATLLRHRVQQRCNQILMIRFAGHALRWTAPLCYPRLFPVPRVKLQPHWVRPPELIPKQPVQAQVAKQAVHGLPFHLQRPSRTMELTMKKTCWQIGAMKKVLNQSFALRTSSRNLLRICDGQATPARMASLKTHSWYMARA